jgi:hypothetical protein
MAKLHGNKLHSRETREGGRRQDTNLTYNARFCGNSIEPGLSLSKDVILYALGRLFILLAAGNSIDTCG